MSLANLLLTGNGNLGNLGLSDRHYLEPGNKAAHNTLRSNLL